MYNISIYMGAPTRFRAREWLGSEIRTQWDPTEEKGVANRSEWDKRRGKRSEGKFHAARDESTYFSASFRNQRRRRRGDTGHIEFKTQGSDTNIFQGTYQEVRIKIWFCPIYHRYIIIACRVTNSSHANPLRKFFYMSSHERRGRSKIVILPKIHRPGRKRYTAFILAFI